MAIQLHARVVNSVGRRIVSRELEPGAVLLGEQIEAEFGVSRSVVREAVRALESLGLVRSVKRLGIRVMPRMEWNLFDPMIVQWRLSSNAERSAQLRSLIELRGAIEPTAAELAAECMSVEQSLELVALADHMLEVGRAADLTTFPALDISYHSLLLRGSGNEMFAKLDVVLAEAFSGRNERGVDPDVPDEESLQLHIEIAAAVHRRKSRAARNAMRRLVDQKRHEYARSETDVSLEAASVFLRDRQT